MSDTFYVHIGYTKYDSHFNTHLDSFDITNKINNKKYLVGVSELFVYYDISNYWHIKKDEVLFTIQTRIGTLGPIVKADSNRFFVNIQEFLDYINALIVAKYKFNFKLEKTKNDTILINFTRDNPTFKDKILKIMFRHPLFETVLGFTLKKQYSCMDISLPINRQALCPNHFFLYFTNIPSQSISNLETPLLTTFVLNNNIYHKQYNPPIYFPIADFSTSRLYLRNSKGQEHIISNTDEFYFNIILHFKAVI